MNTQQQQAVSDVQAELDKEVALGMIQPQDAVEIVREATAALESGDTTPEVLEAVVDRAATLRTTAQAFGIVGQGDTGDEDLASDEDTATDDLDDLLDMGDDMDDEDQS